MYGSVIKYLLWMLEALYLSLSILKTVRGVVKGRRKSGWVKLFKWINFVFSINWSKDLRGVKEGECVIGLQDRIWSPWTGVDTACTAYFLIQPWSISPGVAWIITDVTLPHLSLFKKMPTSLCYDDIFSIEFSFSGP